MSLVAGGVVIEGGGEHRRRVAVVDDQRIVQWFGEESQPHTIASPIPGSAEVRGVDVWSATPVAVLSDGSTFRCHQNSRHQTWHGDRNVLEVRSALTPNAGGSIVLAGFRRSGGFWAAWLVSSARRLGVTNENFVSPEGIGNVIPGDSPIVAARLVGPRGAEVLLGDGRVVAWMPHGWTRIGKFPVSNVVLGGVESKAEGLRRWWCVATDREVFVASGTIDDADSLGVISGTSKVVALRLWNRSVDAFLANGDRAGAFLKKPAAVKSGPDPDEAA